MISCLEANAKSKAIIAITLLMPVLYMLLASLSYYLTLRKGAKEGPLPIPVAALHRNAVLRHSLTELQRPVRLAGTALHRNAATST